MELTQAITRFNEFKDKMKSYQYALQLANWDISTLAPKNGKKEASKAVGYLFSVVLEMKRSQEFKDCFNVLYQHMDKLDMGMKRDVELLNIEFEKTQHIPPDEFRQYKELQAMSQVVWEEAKNKDDIQLFLPYLEKIIAYKKKFIQLAGNHHHPYDYCLDDYENNLTVEKCEKFFAVLKEKTVPLVHKISREGKEVRDDFLYRHYPVKKQKEISYKLLELLNFDIDGGVLAASEHPFTTLICKNDVRLTTHFYEDFLTAALMSTVHEAGHGIHIQNARKSAYAGNMLMMGAMSGISESQSRFYENIICRSKSFWEFFYPVLKQTYNEQLHDVSTDEFYRAINLSKPSLVRIEADELTYNLHILIRYELEKMLFEDTVTVADLPKLWEEKYNEYLGVAPPNNTLGMLQDMHWSGGLFGYFPTYSLGNAYAAQLKQAMEKNLDVNDLCRNGNIKPITSWLNENVHQFGGIKNAEDIMKDATGEGFNPNYLTDYLVDKFTALYF